PPLSRVPLRVAFVARAAVAGSVVASGAARTGDRSVSLNAFQPPPPSPNHVGLPSVSVCVTLPPPPPAAPEIIEIVENNEEIEETIIESTETNQESVIEAPMEVDDVVVEEEEEEVSVPFSVIENAPIFPGCKNVEGNEAKKACFQKKIQEHVAKEFNYPEVALEMGVQGRVFVQFAIDNKGYIADIRVRGPDKNLETEAIRIVAAIPKMTPGMQRGRAVKVPYSIPITFKLQ
ncbi:hypothetical protein LCGC14_3141770, partial [marine sediment metagenome]